MLVRAAFVVVLLGAAACDALNQPAAAPGAPPPIPPPPVGTDTADAGSDALAPLPPGTSHPAVQPQPGDIQL